MSEHPPLFGLSQRLPPANTRAEQSLLGAILANNKAFDRVGEFLAPEHFIDPVHQRIYAAAANLIRANKVADPVTLQLEFQNSGVLDEVGGVAYLAQLLSAMVGIKNAGDYGRAIQDAWIRRQVIDISETMVNQAFGQDAEVETSDIVTGAVAALEETLLKGTQNSETKLSEANRRVMEAMDNARQGEVKVIFSTGLPGLDEIIGGGMRLADLVVLGGRPGHGKSALASQIIKSMARQYEKPILVLSLEMTADQFALRMLAQETRIPMARIETGQLALSEANELIRAQLELDKLPIVFDDRPRQGINQVKMAIRRFKRNHGAPGLIVIDHIHLMPLSKESVKGGLGLTFGVGEIANQLKEVAKDERCPVLALAQLSRNKESADDKVPTMSDLKNSGDIEAAADTVLFTHRPELHLHKAKPTRKPSESDSEYLNRDMAYKALVQETKGKAVLVSGKCRHGQTGAFELEFDGPTTTFFTSF